MNYFTYQTAIGLLTICEENGEITAIGTRCPSEAGLEEETETIREAHTQLTQYLDGRRKSFELPLAPKGTDFQKLVWQELCKIPYGQTRTYKQIAEAIGNPRGVRAVGMANNRNPIIIAIPCHRVIGSDGKMVGYAAGVDKKEFLLRLEGSLL